jgi:hypothetical protein
MEGLVKHVFAFVAKALQAIAARLSLTYEVANILAYYAILPFVFATLLDML